MRNLLAGVIMVLVLVILGGCPPPMTYRDAPVASNSRIYPVSTAEIVTPCQRIYISGVGTNTGIARALGDYGVYDGQCVTPQMLDAIRRILAEHPDYVVEITPEYVYIGPQINTASVIFENTTMAMARATLRTLTGAIVYDHVIRPGSAEVTIVLVGDYQLHVDHWDSSRRLTYDNKVQITHRTPWQQTYSAYAKTRGDRIITISPAPPR